jgi:prepilin-type N-terminal cleavage/methylation domain-containing protein
MPGTKARRGYTLVEVAVAAVILGIMSVGIARAITVSAHGSRVERERAVAMMLARNEAEALRAAGIQGGGITGTDTSVVNEAGESLAGGRYTVIVERTALCAGGTDPLDNAATSPLMGDQCGAVRGAVRYTVRVRYPTRVTTVSPTGADSTTGELRYSTTVGYAARSASARARLPRVETTP